MIKDYSFVSSPYNTPTGTRGRGSRHYMNQAHQPESHCYQQGDWVYVRRHHQETLEPRCKGPFLVVLTTPTALKVDSISTWVHYTHVRPADLLALREEFLPQWKTKLDKTNPLKLKLQRR